MSVEEMIPSSADASQGTALAATDYLDLQRHEALHEVDVSEMALRFSFGQRPDGTASESLE
jgi:hypothetical protein